MVRGKTPRHPHEGGRIMSKRLRNTMKHMLKFACMQMMAHAQPTPHVKGSIENVSLRESPSATQTPPNPQHKSRDLWEIIDILWESQNY